jgi:hypothetical protein
MLIKNSYKRSIDQIKPSRHNLYRSKWLVYYKTKIESHRYK